VRLEMRDPGHDQAREIFERRWIRIAGKHTLDLSLAVLSFHKKILWDLSREILLVVLRGFDDISCHNWLS
jgi:hypothetical protein